MIKEIQNIELNPRSAQYRKEYRQKIRNDIMKAWDNNISKFEFVGDYNYKTLATYANEEASQVIQYIVREQEIDKKYKEQFQLHSYRFYPYGQTSEVIKISSRSMEDRRHVYCEIHKDALETLVYKAAKDKKAQEERAAKKRTENMLVEQNMTVEQAIKWLRPETSKRLINEYELQGGNALAKVDEAIKIVCDYAESMRAKEKPYLN